jgi:hypothetical protein
MNDRPFDGYRWKYVVRDGKLFKTQDKNDIQEGELFGWFSVTPTTPGDTIVGVSKRIIRDKEQPWSDDEMIRSVINFDYYHHQAIMNYILDDGDFYDYWIEDEARVNQKRSRNLGEILNNNI